MSTIVADNIEPRTAGSSTNINANLSSSLPQDHFKNLSEIEHS